jgi:uncharacterized protein (TIGR03435 family)
MTSVRPLAALAFAPLAFGQALPQFEVASIKASAEGAAYTVNIGVHIDGAQVTCTYLSLKDYVRMAYDVKEYQVVSPEWMASERFDIKARLPEGSKGGELRDMLKSLLADRFHMKVHKDSKDFPVYALVVDKAGPKLKESPVEEGDVKVANVTASGGPQGVTVSLGNGSFFTFADNKLEGKKLDMPRFAETMARFTDRPVVDMTGLKGNYDFELKLSDEDFNAMRIRSAITAGVILPPQAMKLLELSSGDSLHSALQSLGLKLEARKAPLEVLVVDSSDKMPTDN